MKTAVVTGGGSGIGLAVVERLRAERKEARSSSSWWPLSIPWEG